MNPTTQNLIAFLHVYDKDTNTLVAQNDHIPDDGWFPTNYWWSGDVIEDRFELHLPPSVQPDSVKLVVGMYDSASMQRLPASDANGSRWKDDVVEISFHSHLDSRGGMESATRHKKTVTILH